MCQKVQTLTRRGVGDAAAGLGLHFLHMSEGPFSHDPGHILIHLTFTKPLAEKEAVWVHTIRRITRRLMLVQAVL